MCDRRRTGGQSCWPSTPRRAAKDKHFDRPQLLADTDAAWSYTVIAWRVGPLIRLERSRPDFDADLLFERDELVVALAARAARS